MTETPFMAQRRKLRELREKQGAAHTTKKKAKKKASKKTSASSTD